MRYLPLYYEWGKTGYMPLPGLCGSLPDGTDDLFSLFEPLFRIGGYWGYDGSAIYGSQVWHDEELLKYVSLQFTPLRQNILLLMAAMNNEL